MKLFDYFLSCSLSLIYFCKLCPPQPTHALSFPSLLHPGAVVPRRMSPGSFHPRGQTEPFPPQVQNHHREAPRGHRGRAEAGEREHRVELRAARHLPALGVSVPDGAAGPASWPRSPWGCSCTLPLPSPLPWLMVTPIGTKPLLVLLLLPQGAEGPAHTHPGQYPGGGSGEMLGVRSVFCRNQ